MIANLNRVKLSEINKTTKRQKITPKEYYQLKLEPVKLTIKEIIDNLELGKNYEYIKTTLDKISKTRLIIKKPDQKEIYIPLLQKATYNPNDSGLIEVIFNQELKPYLLPLKDFTEPDLVPLLSFSFKHSFMFYTYLKMQKQLTKKNEVTLNLDFIYIILGLDKYYKENFNRFKTKILDKVIIDVNNEYSNIHIEKYETIRIGRKIRRIKFYLKSKIKPKKRKLKSSSNIYS